LARFLAFLPSKLPVGKSEFERFASSILTTYGLPDEPGYHHMIASMIQHLPNSKHMVSKRYFMKLIKKAMSNEVAFYVMRDIHENQKKKIEAESLAAQLNKPVGEQELDVEKAPADNPSHSSV
jgi:hypothetical protein